MSETIRRYQQHEIKQVKQVYNDQPLGILALGKIGGGYGSLVSVVSRVWLGWGGRLGWGGWLGCGGWGGLVGGELIVIPFPSSSV